MQASFVGSVRPFTSAGVRPGARPSRVSVPVIENRVALRFQRYGRKKLPFYRLVAIESKEKREGKPLEFLGWYDPMKKETNLNAAAIKRWLSVGAQPSSTVEDLLKRAYVIEPTATAPKAQL